jgi:hypothetical protein
VLSFEKDIVNLFRAQNVPYQFKEEMHLLESSKFSIRFLPNLSKIGLQFNHEPGDDLIHLWEDIYTLKPALVISRFNSLLGLNKRLHGRQTVIKKISKVTYLEFLNQHHLLGATGAKYRLGLYYKNDLVAVAGFGRPCPIDHKGRTYNSVELIRFCNKTGLTVVGGLSKLIDNFLRENPVEHLMTYVDREWSEGVIYHKLGFELLESTAPQVFYLSPDDLQRYRSKNLEREGIDYSSWQKVTNLGNNKYVKILS